MSQSKIRILIAKAGLDGHDRGAKIITRALRDAGFEVIYTGLHQTAEIIAQTVMDEDVDVLGVSILSGSHRHQSIELRKALEKRKIKDLLVVFGGIIPSEDIEELKDNGVDLIFSPGDSIEEIIKNIKENVRLGL